MRYNQYIFDLINRSCEHMTAEQIFLELKKKFPSVVMATIYNNLNTLYQQGAIRKIKIDGKPDRYDKNTRHDHLICNCCGKLSDIVLHDLTQHLEQEIGFQIESYDLKLKYICSNCRK